MKNKINNIGQREDASSFIYSIPNDTPDCPTLLISMQFEWWKPVKGFEGIYEISFNGEVKSLCRIVEKTGVSLQRKVSTKILKPEVTKAGYLRVLLAKEGKNTKCSIHRLVALHFIPNPENKPQINHKNGNKKDCSVPNLEWVTPSENNKHAFDTGLNINVSKMSKAKEKPVILIYPDGYELPYNSITELSKDTKIPRTCIKRVIDGDRDNYKGFKFKLA